MIDLSDNPSLTPFTAHRLHLELEAREPIRLGQHTGSALRGMFYRALMALTGPVQAIGGAQGAGQMQFLPNEPVRYLLASLDEENARGKDIPRPYTLEPTPPPAWMDDTREVRAEVVYAPGQPLRFGFTLYARAMELFPYVILAFKRAEQLGIGRPDENGWRGRFALAQVWCSNPFSGQAQDVFAEGDQLVRVPDLPITHADVLAAPPPSGHTLVLEFHTPMTLRAQGQPVNAPHFSVLLHRLIERLSELSAHFADAPLPGLPASRDERNALLRLADSVRLVHDGTHWVGLNGYSARQQAPTTLSGFVGTAVYEADPAVWAACLPLLRWGEIVHAGKHAVKGNGWYSIAAC
jgi:hypothetical protein